MSAARFPKVKGKVSVVGKRVGLAAKIATSVTSLPPVTSCLVLPVSAWPPQDRTLWELGTMTMRGLRRQRHAETLRPLSIANAWKSYGRFLRVIEEAHDLDTAIGPVERVTESRVADFFDAMRIAGNTDATIKLRLLTLRTAMRIMAPHADFDWITRPGGYSIDAILPSEPHANMPMPQSVVLFNWGRRLMIGDLSGLRTADDLRVNPKAAVARLKFCRSYRDGLLIALFACRAPRLASVASMRLEVNLYQRNGEYWVRLQSMIVKNKRLIEYSLPPELTPFIDIYLAEIRPLLLDPATTDAIWGNGQGTAYRYRAIESMVARRSAAEFGEAFRPHRFRHAFASSMAEIDPGNPGLAAIVLGITEGVVDAHYRRARHRDAGLKLADNLRLERERTRGTAANAYASRYQSPA